VWDLPQSLVNWAQVVGAALGLVAIVVALFALWRQRRDLVIERQAQFELEIIRELIRCVADPQGYQDANVLCSLFPEGLPNFVPIREVLKKIDDGTFPDETIRMDECDRKSLVWLEGRQQMLEGLMRAARWRVEHLGRWEDFKSRIRYRRSERNKRSTNKTPKS
jgi:hypothetical protein